MTPNSSDVIVYGVFHEAGPVSDEISSTLWLRWVRELQAIAQTGLHFTADPFDKERYTRIREIAAEMAVRPSANEYSEILALFTAQSGYATPKVDTRGAVFRDGKILLVRELADDGKWTLPGGWADVNLSPRENVTREIREETGYEARVVKLAAVYDRVMSSRRSPDNFFHVYKMFFICATIGGGPKSSVETVEPTFFRRDEIPELSEVRTSRHHIDRMFAHANNPALLCEFG